MSSVNLFRDLSYQCRVNSILTYYEKLIVGKKQLAKGSISNCCLPIANPEN